MSQLKEAFEALKSAIQSGDKQRITIALKAFANAYGSRAKLYKSISPPTLGGLMVWVLASGAGITASVGISRL